MRSAIALSVAALASLSAAQTTPQNDYPYTIDPNSVSSSDKGVFRRWTLFTIDTDRPSHLVPEPEGAMPAHLPAAARRHHHDHRGQRLRLG